MVGFQLHRYGCCDLRLRVGRASNTNTGETGRRIDLELVEYQLEQMAASKKEAATTPYLVNNNSTRDPKGSKSRNDIPIGRRKITQPGLLYIGFTRRWRCLYLSITVGHVSVRTLQCYWWVRVGMRVVATLTANYIDAKQTSMST